MGYQTSLLALGSEIDNTIQSQQDQIVHLNSLIMWGGDIPDVPRCLVDEGAVAEGFSAVENVWDFRLGFPAAWKTYHYPTGPASHPSTALWQSNRVGINLDEGLLIRAYPGTEASDGSRRVVSGGGGFFNASGASWPGSTTTPSKSVGLSGQFFTSARLRLDPDEEAYMGCVFLLQRVSKAPGDHLILGEVDIFEVGAGVRDRYTMTVHKSHPDTPTVDVKKQVTFQSDTTRWATYGALVDSFAGRVHMTIDDTYLGSVQNEAFKTFGTFRPVFQTEAFKLPTSDFQRDASGMHVMWCYTAQF